MGSELPFKESREALDGDHEEAETADSDGTSAWHLWAPFTGHLSAPLSMPMGDPDAAAGDGLASVPYRWADLTLKLANRSVQTSENEMISNTSVNCSLATGMQNGKEALGGAACSSHTRSLQASRLGCRKSAFSGDASSMDDPGSRLVAPLVLSW